jgi:hypothetical protein
MKRLCAFLPLGMILLTSCATPRQTVKAAPRFHETQNADLVVRFYSENISRILKPMQMEGPFLSTFDRSGVLDLAKQQSGRELAVVVLLQFNSSDRVKQSWLTPLKDLGYKRIVFLRAENSLRVDGLSVLDSPSLGTDQPSTPSDPRLFSVNAGGG